MNDGVANETVPAEVGKGAAVFVPFVVTSDGKTARPACPAEIGGVNVAFNEVRNPNAVSTSLRAAPCNWFLAALT